MDSVCRNPANGPTLPAVRPALWYGIPRLTCSAQRKPGLQLPQPLRTPSESLSLAVATSLIWCKHILTSSSSPLTPPHLSKLYQGETLPTPPAPTSWMKCHTPMRFQGILGLSHSGITCTCFSYHWLLSSIHLKKTGT